MMRQGSNRGKVVMRHKAGDEVHELFYVAQLCRQDSPLLVDKAEQAQSVSRRHVQV